MSRSSEACRHPLRALATLTFFVSCLVASICSADPQVADSAPVDASIVLARRLAVASKSKLYVTSPADELHAVERLFESTLRAARNPDIESANQLLAMLVDDWQQWTMRLEQIEAGEFSCWTLSEESSDRRGRGFYAFRPATANSMALQAPHSFYDQHTRSINVQLFVTEPFAAAAWNTVKRSKMDLAHSRYHYLNAFTAAFASSVPGAKTVQLHGFAREKRSSEAGFKADMIISDGTRVPASTARELTVRLQASMLDYSVALFPNDCDELGATTNTQGKLLRSAGNSGFLHLEMSQSMRDGLRRDASVRSELLKALVAIHRR